jgi:UDP-N-acetylbacillosamine transaminase
VSERIFLSAPHMGGNEIKYIQEAFDANYIAPIGEQITKFEEAIKAYTGAKHAVALSSGTAAIHLALRTLGIKDGDEVFASSFTFIGGIAPIMYERCVPFFIDSDEDSWNLDPLLLLEELDRRKKSNAKIPKALILAHLYGQAAKMEEIKAICDKYEVAIIEDAAESLGATVGGKHTGTIGKAGIYSFNGNKIITSSGGGMLVTDDERMAKEARFLSTQAKEPYLHYEHETYGYNYRMSNIVAAIGRGQMEVLPKRVERRREIFALYKELLKDISEIKFMPEIAGSRGNRWLTTLYMDTKLKTTPNDIIKALEEQNIESRPLWKPMHTQPLFKDAGHIANGFSEMLFDRGLCLPSGSSMDDEAVMLVAKIVRAVVAK